jgi:hypothetical protein
MKLTVDVKLVIDNEPELKKALEALQKYELLVGFPEDKAEDRSDTDLSNAEIAYIQDRGSPASNIRARPFLEPGVLSVQESLEGQLQKAATAALEGDPGAVEQRFNAAGLVAQAGIRSYLTNAPFAPLSWRTLSARRSRGFYGEKPLIETGQLRAAVNYVLRRR